MNHSDLLPTAEQFAKELPADSVRMAYVFALAKRFTGMTSIRSRCCWTARPANTGSERSASWTSQPAADLALRYAIEHLDADERRRYRILNKT
ncbi:MAG TPA: hypothetical protein VLJ88_00265 [Propionibacteriaceae bacterium]|nr:hypothetical protein [Propionibacteriaceae bacterium]